LCFADLAEAAAAFALDPGLAFRCNVCGAVHRVKGRGWHKCAEGFSQRWRLECSLQRGSLAEEARARPNAWLKRYWGPSLPEILAERRFFRGIDLPQPNRVEHDLVPKESLEVPLLWLLSLEGAAVAEALRSVWQKWWERVENVIRETKVQLVQTVGRLEPWEGFEPTEVKQDDLLGRVIVDHREESLCRIDRMLVGRHAIVWKPEWLRYDKRVLDHG
jgi:hypothetical protein